MKNSYLTKIIQEYWGLSSKILCKIKSASWITTLNLWANLFIKIKNVECKKI